MPLLLEEGTILWRHLRPTLRRYGHAYLRVAEVWHTAHHVGHAHVGAHVLHTGRHVHRTSVDVGHGVANIQILHSTGTHVHPGHSTHTRVHGAHRGLAHAALLLLKELRRGERQIRALRM